MASTAPIVSAQKAARQAILDAQAMLDGVKSTVTPQRTSTAPRFATPMARWESPVARSESPEAYALAQVVYHANAHVSTMQHRLEEV